jgi:hypothetical protein
LTIVLLAEGDTERALTEHLKVFLDQRATLEHKLRGALAARTYAALRPDKLRRQVQLLLAEPGVTAVVGLIDVFPNFTHAADAKLWLREAVHEDERFFAHAAQYDVEAWLLPYWHDICRRLKIERRSPGTHPEFVNGQNPPAYHLEELYRLAKPKARKYSKPIEMREILRGKDLAIAAAACPEFRLFLNTLLELNSLAHLP